MKIRTNDITSWIFCDDANAGTTPIEETRCVRRESNETTEPERALMVLGALAVWTGVVLILWP